MINDCIFNPALNTGMQKRIEDFRQIVIEADTKKDKLTLSILPYKHGDLSPVLSEESIKLHYDQLAKGYVTRYNRGEGDPDFNKAGAFLHNIFFPQLQSPGSNNKPFGSSENFVNKHFSRGFEELKDEFEKTAMQIQGSGWVYLSRNGQIKTIKNHQIKQDIILLIDWWEHSWFTDYGSDKIKYLKNIWRAINWSVINDRINLE